MSKTKRVVTIVLILLTLSRIACGCEDIDVDTGVGDVDFNNITGMNDCDEGENPIVCGEYGTEVCCVKE